MCIWTRPLQGRDAASGKIIAVNGRHSPPTFCMKPSRIRVKDPSPIELLIKDGEYYKTFQLDYHGGEKYPHLVRDTAKPDLISDIIRPHALRAKK